MARDKGDDDNGFGAWGGYMDAKVSKLEEQYAQSSTTFRKSNLFVGISIYVNGLTNPSSDELKHIMMTNGGTYHHYERKHTTFIIASNLPDVKIRNMNTSKIISPQWILDCLTEQRIIDYTNYLLYTNRKKSQPQITFINKTKNNETYLKNEKMRLSSHKHQEIDYSNTLQLNKMNAKENQSHNINLKLDNSCSASENIPNNSVEVNEDKNKKVINCNTFDINEIGRDLDVLNKKIRFNAMKDVSNESILLPAPQKIQLNNSKINTSSSSSGLARTANDPNFLKEFYNNSRLHHIATLGASFKQYITQLREENSSMYFPKRTILKERLIQKVNFICPQTIMHIDMDCFFVSVGLKKFPELRGKPVAVTHSKGGGEIIERPGVDRNLERNLYMKRLGDKLHENINGEKKDKIKNGFEGKDSLSELASCSYEARRMGVKNGMFIGEALKLCPQLITIPYDFDGYKEVATSLYNIITQYTLNVEAVSCDEMFVDLTDLLNDIKVEPIDFISFVRQEVREQTGCPCSAGIGANRLQARMATKKAKPDGQFFLNSESVEDYMSEIPISELPGVGYSTSNTLKQKNLFTCGDLQKCSLAKIQMEIGKKFGETLYQYCRGIDNRPLVYGQIRKSVSAEVNYGIRFKDNIEMEIFLKQLCVEVHSRLMETKRKGKCIILKVMTRAKEAPIETAKFMGHGYCDNQSKSVTLSAFTDSLETITRTVLATMKSLSINPSELRGIGIQISKLEEPNVAKSNKKTNVLLNMFNKRFAKLKDKKVNVEPSEVSTNETNLTETLNTTNIDNQTPAEVNHLKRMSPVKHLKQPDFKKKCTRPAKEGAKQNIKKMLAEIVPPTNANPYFSYENIDQNVLRELPANIQEEILDEQKKINTLKLRNKKIQPGELQNRNIDRQDNNNPFLNRISINEIEEHPIQQKNYKSPVKIFKSPHKKSKSPMKKKTSFMDHKSYLHSFKKMFNNIKPKEKPSTITSSDKTTTPVTSTITSGVKVWTEKPATITSNTKICTEKTSPVTSSGKISEEKTSTITSSGKISEEKTSTITSSGKISEKKTSTITCSGKVSTEKTSSVITSNKINDTLHKELTENIFLEENCIALLKKWIAKNRKPSINDIEFLNESATLMIRKRSIIDLYEPIVELRNLINKSKNCAWHNVYKNFVDVVQNEMKKIYGSRLLLTETLDCKNCK